MSIRLLLLLAATASFGALSFVALLDVGYIGIFEAGLDSWATRQVVADLVIVAVLSAVWMVHDAHRRGTNPWPFVALTLFAGSFGPLLYLIVRELRAPAPQPALA
jgi:hypothetical protein